MLVVSCIMINIYVVIMVWHWVFQLSQCTLIGNSGLVRDGGGTVCSVPSLVRHYLYQQLMGGVWLHWLRWNIKMVTMMLDWSWALIGSDSMYDLIASWTGQSKKLYSIMILNKPTVWTKPLNLVLCCCVSWNNYLTENAKVNLKWTLKRLWLVRF